MAVKSLKSYKGFDIEKSYDEKPDGTIKKDTIIYTAYPVDSYGVLQGAEAVCLRESDGGENVRQPGSQVAKRRLNS